MSMTVFYLNAFSFGLFSPHSVRVSVTMCGAILTSSKIEAQQEVFVTLR